MTVSAITSNRIQQAIASAASATGVDFSYLLGQAKLESGLNASAHAATSSASGLYQFIEKSWLSVVKKHGAEHGLGWAADAIQQDANGKLSVADGASRQAILALRNDPATASVMAAEYASDNKGGIEAATGRAATGTDLYMAHFLGLGGARKFLTTMAADPSATGAAMFPAAAAANRGVFYAADGSAKSLSDIYQHFAGKLGSAALPGGNALPQVQYAAQTLTTDDGATVVTGTGESVTNAMAWARSTMNQLGGRQTLAAATTSVYRPTPDTARLAYMMLAGLGA